MTTELHQGDNREVLAGYPDNYFDSCVTDPPYGLTSIVKRFGRTNLEDNNQTGQDARDRSTPQARLSRGFMGKEWDGSGIEYDVNFWHLVYQKLKPGAHLLAFGGTRTYHRITCAIEDAGFEIRDQLQWIYGSGFPKSHNLEGEWEGWGTALKPAFEPICLARKPLIGTVANNVLEYGTGALNIDGCRIGDEIWTRKGGNNSTPYGSNITWSVSKTPDIDRSASGRWPANVLFDEAAAEMLDQQTGSFGGASRFFYCSKASGRERNLGLGELEAQVTLIGQTGLKINPMTGKPVVDIPRKNTHPTVKPIDVMRWLCKLITPPGGIIVDPFTGSGSTGCAAVLEGFNFVGMDLDPEYVDIARRRIAYWSSRVQLELFGP